MIEAFKLLRVRKDETLGSLFINRRARLLTGEWLAAEDHETEGYAHRPGWHAMARPVAPHLSLHGRRWFRVVLEDAEEVQRPESQGGLWYLAQKMMILEEVQ